MKKITVMLVLLLASSTAFAQEGVKVGLRFSPIFGSARVTDSTSTVQSEGYGSRVGMAYGLVVNYGFSESIGISTGVSLVNKGYAYKADVAGTSVSLKQKVTYAELPIALRMRSPEIGGVSGLHIRGLIGPSLNVQVGAENKTKIGSAASVTRKNPKDFNTVAADALFGLGVDWTIDGVGTIDAGVSYHRGLLNTAKNAGKGSQKLNYFSIDIAYMF